MKRILVYILIFCLTTSGLQAQKKSKSFSVLDEENAIYKNEWSLGMRMHTNGYSAYFERVWIKSIWKKRVLQTNFFYFKDFREKKIKTIYTDVFNAKKYFYGKQNNFWSINVLYGQKKVLGEKADKNGVRVSMIYLGGVSLGVIKPYAILLTEPGVEQPVTEVTFYDESNEAAFLDLDPTQVVYGAAGLRYGWNRLQPVPGVHGKFGFNFDWASKEYLVKSIEIGAQLDIYYRTLPVMVSERNRPFILNLYLAFQLGKRW